MTYKIVISKPGFDAVTETTPDNLIFSSDYNTLKYNVSGSITLNVTGGPAYAQNTTVTHGLGYTPFFVAYAIDSDTMSRYGPLGNNIQAPDGIGSFRWYYVLADSTKLYFCVLGDTLLTPSYTITFQYKIFKNNLNL